MTANQRPVNYIIVGLGNIGSEYEETRHNAGSIFINYLSNALELAKGSSKAPVFQRMPHLSADILDTRLEVTSNSVSNSLRVLLVKPLTMMNDAGTAVHKVLFNYGITDPVTIKQKLLVVADDLNTLPGALSIQTGGTLRSLAGHKGVESICQQLNTTNFVRFRLGIGRPAAGMSIPNWVLSKFTTEKNEMNLFGYVLEQTAAALQEFAVSNDLQKVKKKYASSKKMPKNMTDMISLDFPVQTNGY
ncbi:hypothetical protein INT43_008527 [Umbelopsis isabellina]|uniref:Peptidyl-tRNA hydrolase n=1 Tax=Mortierella isabellina TaxID=91625 RepID=A0A8H7PV99_MORIS|nr:hypothetical protein INT43_008527 [Umbelopsis isabellina]